MSDQTNEQGVPDLNFQMGPLAPEIEIVDESVLQAQREGEFAEKSREELIAEVQTMKEAATQAAPTTASETDSLRAELDLMKQNMNGALTKDQLEAVTSLNRQTPQQPRESEAEFAERIKTSMYDNPTAALDEYMARKLVPEVNRLAANNLYHAKQFLSLDPQKGDNFRKHESEIEAEVQRMDANTKLYDPDVYQKAYRAVMMNNIDDLVAEGVKVALAKQTNGNVDSASANTSFTELGVGNPNPAAAKGKKIQISLTREEKLKAAGKGLSEARYGEILHRRGEK